MEQNGRRVLAVLTAGGCAPMTGQDPDRAVARERRLVAAAVRRDPRLAGCGEMARLDFKALDARLANDARPSSDVVAAEAEARHREVRGPLGGFAPPADATVLSLVVGSTGHQSVATRTSSYVWKGADGVWRVDRVDDVIGGPPPPPRRQDQPPMTEDDMARARRETFAGVLNPGMAALLDRTLNDVCLTLQPDHVPMDAPLITGEDDFCYGGTVLIRRDGRLRAISDDCARYIGGEVIKAVMYARPEGE